MAPNRNCVKRRIDAAAKIKGLIFYKNKRLKAALFVKNAGV